jgi:uncharacterized protein (TIGR01777 family)
MPVVLITGGTGLIGKNLTAYLTGRGYEVIILSRKAIADRKETLVSYAQWNIKKQQIDIDALAKADCIIHLAGAGIADKRWSKKRKRQIVESRTKSSELLVKALKENINKVKTVISASAIGWYGEDGAGDLPFVEAVPAAENFLGQTCKEWEESIEPVTLLGKRLVKIRTGIVLSKNGGALAEFIKPLRFGIAAILGNGKQIISWIHIDDLVRIYMAAIENNKINGPYNAVAPLPVTNRELVLQLARANRKIFFVPVHVPSFVLKIFLGEMSIEVLKSTTVSCNKIKGTGFTFLYPTVNAALKELFSSGTLLH